MSEEAKSAIERHAQTILSAVVLGLLTWTGLTILDVRDRLGKMEVVQLQIADQNRIESERTKEIEKRIREMELLNARAGK